MQNYDVIVIGQGYAGLKAAKLAAERGLKTATVEAVFPGGLVMSINELHPAPEGEEPCGPELTGGLAMANMDNGIENLSGIVTGLARGDGNAWQVTTDSDACTASNVIIASGARLRRLGVPGEEENIGRGVSACADCDGPLYQNKEAVVVGGGDSAFQEALALTAYCSRVTIVMRGQSSRARADLVEAVAGNPKIELLSGTEVTEVLSDASGVTGIAIRGAGGDATLNAMVLFVFVGLRPDADYLPAEVNRDEAGAVVTGENLSASLPGLYAIGAVRSGFGGLLSDASADAERVVAAI